MVLGLLNGVSGLGFQAFEGIRALCLPRVSSVVGVRVLTLNPKP